MQWLVLLQAERQRIVEALGSMDERVEHFGSTAVLDLPAKDTLDLLVEQPSGADEPAG